MDNQVNHSSTTNQTPARAKAYALGGLLMLGAVAIYIFFSLFSASLPVQVGSGGIEKYQVVDKNDGRYLVTEGRVKDCVDQADMQSYSRYVAVLELPSHMFITPGRLFLSGLGTGSIARVYRSRGWEVEIAEKDNSLVTLAQTRFGFSREKTLLHEADGREQLQRSDSSYDVILIDCINQGNYPALQLTEDFFKIASRKLAPGGIFAISLETMGWRDEVVLALFRSLNQVFADVYVYPIVEPPNSFGSIVLMGSDSPRESLVRDIGRNETFSPYWRFGPDYQKAHAWDNRFKPDKSEGYLLTDEKPLSRENIDRLKLASWKVSSDYLP